MWAVTIQGDAPAKVFPACPGAPHLWKAPNHRLTPDDGRYRVPAPPPSQLLRPPGQTYIVIRYTSGAANGMNGRYLASSMLQALFAIAPNLALAQSNPPLEDPLPFPGFNCTVNEYIDRMATINGSSHSRVQQTWALLGR